MGKPVQPVWNQQDYAFYQSDGTTIIGTAGTQQTLTTDTTYYVRLAIGDTNNTNQAVDLTINWQYNLAAGGWNEITDTSPVQHANGSLTDGASITSSTLTAIGTFNNGRVYESESTATVVYTTPADETDTYTEVMLGFTIDSAQVSDGQEVLIRATFGDGTAFDVYTDADIDIDEPLGPVTGAASVTETADTLSATGTVPITAAAAVTETADTLTATGNVPIDGSSSVTENADTLSATGTVQDQPVTGAANLTEAADTLSATGTVPITAAASVTEAADTLTATGTVPITAAASVTENADTLAATGTVPITAAASVTEAADTLSATGSLATTVTGAANLTEADDTLTATGTVPITAAAAVTETADTLAATGDVPISASAALTEANDTLSATGSLATEVTGSANLTEAADTLSATGTVPINATAALSEANDTLSATATVPIQGATSVTENDDTLTATGTVPISASAALTEADDTLAATGQAGFGTVTATANLTEDNDTLSATGTVPISGSLSVTEADDTLVGTGVYTVSTEYQLLQYVNEVWVYLGLERGSPITFTQSATTGGGLTMAISGNGEDNATATRTGALLTPVGGSDVAQQALAKAKEIWQVMGLDPNNALTTTDTSRSVGEITQSITGDAVNTSTVTRTDNFDYIDINAGGNDLLINATDKLTRKEY